MFPDRRILTIIEQLEQELNRKLTAEELRVFGLIDSSPESTPEKDDERGDQTNSA